VEAGAIRRIGDIGQIAASEATQSTSANASPNFN